jgi:hypothetical protein
MPNGALSSLAGNVDPHHRIAIADLILVQREVRATVERLVAHCHLLAQLYARTGKREQAQEHLTTARTMYREMGMT